MKSSLFNTVRNLKADSFLPFPLLVRLATQFPNLVRTMACNNHCFIDGNFPSSVNPRWDGTRANVKV